MVNKDECMMEAFKPRIVWIMPMGYEVDEATLDAYAQHLLQAPVDKKRKEIWHNLGERVKGSPRTGCTNNQKKNDQGCSQDFNKLRT